MYDDEQDDWSDEYGDSSEPTLITCKECGCQADDDAIRFPVCNNYLSAGSIKMHWRWVAFALLAIGVAWMIHMINLTLKK